MQKDRTVARVLRGRPTIEGAGVHLKRVFGFSDTGETDPFLLFDHFGSDRPEAYLPGFPWHPHRGMETVTVVLKGKVAHGDSLGNAGVIGPGDVQWMTAGSGILHQEMPEGDGAGWMEGFQLWVNLPAARKMTPPRYQDIAANRLPTVSLEGGGSVRVIAGTHGGTTGPVTGVSMDPTVLDIRLPGGKTFAHGIPSDRNGFVYVFEGGVTVAGTAVPSGSAAVLGSGDNLSVLAAAEGASFLLVYGTPIREPVAWRGPIVMNTEAELDAAFEELRTGRFIRQ